MSVLRKSGTHARFDTPKDLTLGMSASVTIQLFSSQILCSKSANRPFQRFYLGLFLRALSWFCVDFIILSAKLEFASSSGICSDRIQLFLCEIRNSSFPNLFVLNFCNIIFKQLESSWMNLHSLKYTFVKYVNTKKKSNNNEKISWFLFKTFYYFNRMQLSGSNESIFRE